MNLNTQWILGLIEGKGFFSIFLKNQVLIPEFKVILELKDIQVLYALKKYFKCGKVYSFPQSNKCVLSISKITHLLTNIIPFFEKHKLKTKKRIEFEKFRVSLIYLQKNKHLTLETKIHLI